ncbi:ATP-binding protein [Enterovirga sp. CN4-39]|uniref:ATP-binding protein n=1 Tax=Enterovirga sp. CN4-39 TaxID=3400910 RepID=UPI003C00F633
MAIVDPSRLLASLCAEPRESEWLEFKLNRFVPEDVGRYVSGLANSAMLAGQERAYLIFGVEDDTHEVVGTQVRLKEEKVGEQLFEQWLSRLLEPRINLEFVAFEHEGRLVEMIAIDPGYIRPVRFKSEPFVRVNSVQQPLRDFPERERALWAITSRYSFEQGIAATHLDKRDILERFDCDELFSTLGLRRLSPASVFDQLMMEGLIVDDRQGGYDVTNFLAIVAAKKLTEFPLLSRKAPRVITYSEPNKMSGVDDVTGERGYGVTFQRLLRYILDRVPHKEVIVHGVRTKRFTIPEIAIREFVANALIHQDLTSVGDGPRIEIFPDKIRITNPGRPLISPDRFIDAPSRSRNEKLAGLMRRLGFCEERGSGVDRAVEAIETAALPPPQLPGSRRLYRRYDLRRETVRRNVERGANSGLLSARPTSVRSRVHDEQRKPSSSPRAF